MATILYYSPNYIRPIVPVCLAKYFKTDIKCVDIATDKENFVRDFPLQKCPTLINKEKGIYLTESIAIYNYIIKNSCPEDEIKNLLGATVLEQSEILRWESLSVSDFCTRAYNYLAPLLGFIPYEAEANSKAKKQFETVLQIYEDCLRDHQFLVGHHLTLADLCSAGSFYFGFKFAFDRHWSKQYPHITRWYKEVTQSPYIEEFFMDKEQAKSFPQPPN